MSPALGTEQANALISEIVSGFKQGVDYGQIPGVAKPSMYKPGAEKVCFRFNLDPQFVRDEEMYQMLPNVQNMIAFKCVLINRFTKERVGEGRGSTIVGSRPNCKDPNNATKMAQKSAQIDAALRTFALSSRFTQDVEDMDLKINVTEKSTGKKSTITIDPVNGSVKEENL